VHLAGGGRVSGGLIPAAPAAQPRRRVMATGTGSKENAACVFTSGGCSLFSIEYRSL